MIEQSGQPSEEQNPIEETPKTSEYSPEELAELAQIIAPDETVSDQIERALETIRLTQIHIYNKTHDEKFSSDTTFRDIITKRLTEDFNESLSGQESLKELLQKLLEHQKKK